MKGMRGDGKPSLAQRLAGTKDQEEEKGVWVEHYLPIGMALLFLRGSIRSVVAGLFP